MWQCGQRPCRHLVLFTDVNDNEIIAHARIDCREIHVERTFELVWSRQLDLIGGAAADLAIGEAAGADLGAAKTQQVNH